MKKFRFAVVISGLGLLLGISVGSAQAAGPTRKGPPLLAAWVKGGPSGGAAVPTAPIPDGGTPAASLRDATSSSADLPEAPAPNFAGAPARGATAAESTSVIAVSPAQDRVSPEDCSLDTSHSRRCRVHWHQLIIEGTLFNAFQDAGNLYTGYWYRWETTNGDWWDRYINSAAGWAWNRWPDYNPFLDDYVGHPMMGAITNDLWIQNDPKGMAVVQSKSWPYWRRLLRAGTFSTAYSFWWKLGPTGEAAIGHNGDHNIPDASGKHVSNETGWVELVTTPVGGALWTMAEDAMDKHVVAPVEGSGRNPFAMIGLSFLEPAHATANIFRFRPPWYRDDRVAKAKSFWSDPPGENEVRFGTADSGSSGNEGGEAESSSVVSPMPAGGAPHNA